MKPMTLDEAALEMEGRADGVLVFRDAATERVQRPVPAQGRQPGADRARGLMPPRARGGPALPVAPPRGEGPGVAVAELLDPAAQPLKLDLAAGRAGLEHRVHLPRVQRPGLALTGYTDYIRYGRVQIVGSSEVGYLRKLPPRRRSAILAKLCRCRITCFVVTKGLVPPTELLSAAEARGIPVLTTPLESTAFIKLLSAFLEERLATRLHLHSVLLDVFGLGVLILGESGIGKSECALDLIDRGHRLVADDVVEIKRMGDVLVGVSPDLTRFHMELRGLGVLNIKDLYGVSSMRLSQEGRARHPARALGGGQGVRPPGPARRDLPHPGRRGARWSACRWRPAATSPSSSRWRRATSCCARAATTRRSASSSGWTSSSARRRRPRRPARRRR